MSTDRYTKIMLTLIAVGLFANAGTNMIPRAEAGYGDVQKVSIVSVTDLAYYTAFRLAMPLDVNCTNCN